MSDETQKQDVITQENSAPPPKKQSNVVWQKIKSILNYIFIDGLSGMALGLFATLIIGTIICQIGSFFGQSKFAYFVKACGTFAKILMGAGIGVGMAYKLKKSPLVAVSAGVTGMIGAFASQILAGYDLLNMSATQQLLKDFGIFNTSMGITKLTAVGEPLGAFIAAFVAIEVGSLVSGKTKVDIILTPLVAITTGSVIGLLVGPPISGVMKAIGNIINTGAEQQPVLMGIIVATIMGVCLTLPISSAAIGVSLGLNGIAAGAAVIGCSCQMIGFAIMSFRENKWSGLVAQGLGTSMLQMPNLVKHPICWLPPVIASAILGPIGAVCNITSTPVGSGMGTSGLVGVIETVSALKNGGQNPAISVLLTLLFLVVLPFILVLLISELFRKFGLIKKDDLKLEL